MYETHSTTLEECSMHRVAMSVSRWVLGSFVFELFQFVRRYMENKVFILTYMSFMENKVFILTHMSFAV